jgi:hypothetical protein
VRASAGRDERPKHAKKNTTDYHGAGSERPNLKSMELWDLSPRRGIGTHLTKMRMFCRKSATPPYRSFCSAIVSVNNMNTDRLSMCCTDMTHVAAMMAANETMKPIKRNTFEPGLRQYTDNSAWHTSGPQAAGLVCAALDVCQGNSIDPATSVDTVSHNQTSKAQWFQQLRRDGPPR